MGFLGMLVATLGATLMGSMFSGKGVVRDGDWLIQRGGGVIRPGQDFYCCVILQLILKFTNITKTNLILMVFIPEIIYLK